MEDKRKTFLKGLIAAATIFLARKLKLQRIVSAAAIGLFLYKMGAATPPKGVMAAPGRLPWFGHFLLGLKAREQAHETFLEYSRLCNFKTFHASLVFGPEVLALHDQRDREYMLKGNFENYPKNYDSLNGFNKAMGDLLGEGIFSVDDQEWRTHRKVAANLFTERNIGVVMGKIFAEHALLLRDTLKQFAKEKKSFDVQLLLQALIFDAFCEIAFGVSPNSFEAAKQGVKQPFQVSFDEVQQLATDRLWDPPLLRDFKIFFQIGKEISMTKNLRVVNGFIEDIIVKRKMDLNNGAEHKRNDILGLYISHAEKNNRPELLEVKYLRDVIMNFMIAGRDTTSFVLTNIISLVAENPTFEKKLVSELSGKLNHGLDHFLRNEVKDFPLADAAFNEALRMYPSVPNDTRFCKKDDVLPSGIHVRAGTMVLIPNQSIGRNPEICKDPDSYIPERWLTMKNGKLCCKKINEYKYPFFWGGYRVCLGKDMARREAKIFTSILFKSFKFKYARAKLESYGNGPVPFYKNGIHLVAIERD
mmetsp:Transcript_4094/g.5030  ORF Transcript_4094/g.5030 Transcript_4094/m.5030 type:complete len:531 (+) Transcript_4094:139-1731(+)